MPQDEADGLSHLRPLSRVKARLVRSALEIEAEEPSSVVYQHTVLCQTCLPYRDPGDEVREWQRKQGAVSLKVAAGEACDPATGEWVKLGLPHGPKPRLILAYLNHEALRRGSPEIEVEDSLTAFVKRVGLIGHGRDVRAVKDQLARLAAAQIRMAMAYGAEHARQVQAHVISGFDLWFLKDDQQRVLWPTVVRLSLDYFESLQRHAVPLDERAIGALAHSAMGLDVYCWLAQRLHRVEPGKPQFVSWKALKDQFGQGYRHIRQFRAAFLKVLAEVRTQYRGTLIDIDEKGIWLHHGPPPVLCRRSPVITGSKGGDGK